MGENWEDMQPVRGLISQHRGRVYNARVKPSFPEDTEQGFPCAGIVVVAAFLIGLYGFPVGIRSGLGVERSRFLAAFRIGPASKPALTVAPSVVVLAATCAGNGTGPQVFGVTHLSLLLFKPNTDIFRLVTQMTADTAAFRTDALVPPLVESRDRDTA